MNKVEIKFDKDKNVYLRVNHGEWISHIQSGDYKNWISKNYTEMGR